MGRWLLIHAPAVGRQYAALLTSRQRAPRISPGWTFGYEYFIERRWLAQRRGALWEFALQRGLSVPLTVPWHESTRVEVTLGNDMSLCLYVAGSFEPNEFAFLDQLLKPGMTFIDIGANEGLFSLFAARRVGPSGRVVSVEPSSRERHQLKRNLQRNRIGGVTVVPHALASEAGTAPLQIAAKLHGGHNTLGSFTYDDVRAVSTEEVPVETLDTLVRRLSLGRIDAIKIDVEGAELKVLRGGAETLRTLRPVLLIEANEGALAGQGASAAAVIKLLEELGYVVCVFSEHTGKVERRVPGDVLSANIVAIPRQSTVPRLRLVSAGGYGKADWDYRR
jgi:FkbM family methyltransferase